MLETELQDQRRRTRAVVDLVTRKLLGKPIIVNHMRGCVVEAIVDQALGADWTWCAEDWAGWDFSHGDGLKLEVKQSAAQQSWTKEGGKPSRCQFDIASRLSRYDGADLIRNDMPARWADIYVLAHHSIMGLSADHRDPEQWTFYVLPAARLPGQKQIALSRVQQLAEPCRSAELPRHVDSVAMAIRR